MIPDDFSASIKETMRALIEGYIAKDWLQEHGDCEKCDAGAAAFVSSEVTIDKAHEYVCAEALKNLRTQAEADMIVAMYIGAKKAHERLHRERYYIKLGEDKGLRFI